MAASHTIERQIFELNCPNAGLGKNLLAKIEEAYYAQLLPVIEQVFDDLSVDGMDLVIDELSLDLGDLSLAQLENELPLIVKRSLRSKLIEIQQGSDRETKHEVVAQPRMRQDALESFLNTGLGPWWMSAADFQPWKMFESLFENDPAAFKRFILGGGLASNPNAKVGSGTFSKYSAVYTRIAGAAKSFPFELALKGLLGRNIAREVLGLLELLVAVGKSAGLDSIQLWKLKTAILEAAGKWKGISEIDAEFFSLWEAASLELSIWNSEGFAGILKRKTNDSDSGNKASDLFRKWLESKPKQSKRSAGSQNEDAIPSQSKKQKAHREGDLEAFLAALQNSQNAVDEPQELYIDNAGLVILAAFLPNFFAHQELMSDGQFRNEAAQHRALQLTTVLTHGLNPVEEHQLSFSKLICGLPLDTAIDLSQNPKKSDLEAADALLSAVIEYWAVLGSIAPDQLRGGFLLREGWLSNTAGGWKLRVDRKGYDVVLEQLPWAIGIIALPWLDEQVWVEW